MISMAECHCSGTSRHVTLPPRASSNVGVLSIGSINGINAVYFAIEIENAALRADAKERMASTTAGDVGFVTEFREPMGSAA